MKSSAHNLISFHTEFHTGVSRVTEKGSHAGIVNAGVNGVFNVAQRHPVGNITAGIILQYCIFVL